VTLCEARSDVHTLPKWRVRDLVERVEQNGGEKGRSPVSERIFTGGGIGRAASRRKGVEGKFNPPFN